MCARPAWSARPPRSPTAPEHRPALTRGRTRETGRDYGYAILRAPFPVAGYVSTLRVHTVPGRGGVAEVQWSGRVNPEGATEQEVVDLFTGIYADGLDALHETLSA
ncbi:SRPBCC family protein [Kitasatospora xanthocidica]|uniref:SRPBCC family protein n=1 Tax=Kitasatospora xanthocidica TaxID=83382 RepID=UPI001677EA4F